MRDEQTLFAYDDGVTGRYPTIRAGVVHSTGLANGPSPPGLLDEYGEWQRTAAGRLEGTAMAEVPSIAAWRRVFADFGARPTKYRNAAEALLRRLQKSGGIPTINTLVDVGNLVSIRHAMPVAVFDRASVAGALTVRFATGAEPFADLGSSEDAHPDPGEVVFVDDGDVVCARRWCWRQSAGSLTGPATTEALIVVEGHHETAGRDVESALADLAALQARYQPESRTEAWALSPAKPRAGKAARDGGG